MADIIQIRRGTAASWTATNPILADGEMGLEKDTKKIKFGDGITAWNSLTYYGADLTSLNLAAGAFTGIFNVSHGKNYFYDDYDSGPIINLSLSEAKTLGSIVTVRVKGDLLGTIPSDWNLSGRAITNSPSKFNELTLLYNNSQDVRIVNRIFDYIDTQAPSIPQNLVSSEISDTTVLLAWDESTDNVGVVSYKIYQGGLFLISSITNSINITGLTADTAYSFTVSALDSAGNESDPSTAVIVTTEPSGAYESEYQAMLDYANANGFVVPSLDQQIIDNQKILNLKAEAIWNELEILYITDAVYSEVSYSSNFYRLNWKNPATKILTAPGGLEPIFESGKGFKSTGGSGRYFNTGYVPSTDAVTAIKSSNSMFFKLFDAPTSFATASYFAGGRLANNDEQTLIGNTGNGTMLTRLNHGNVLNIAFTQANINSHFHIATSGDNLYRYINGALHVSGTHTPSLGLSPVSQYLFAYSENGSPVTPGGTIGIAYFAIGSDLTAKQLVLYQILNGLY